MSRERDKIALEAMKSLIISTRAENDPNNFVSWNQWVSTWSYQLADSMIKESKIKKRGK